LYLFFTYTSVFAMQILRAVATDIPMVSYGWPWISPWITTVSLD